MIMKKFITIIITLVLLCTSCTKKDYALTYKVYYPDNTVTKTYNFTSPFNEKQAVGLYSNRGSNFLFVRTKGNIESTSAPIEIISLERK